MKKLIIPAFIVLLLACAQDSKSVNHSGAAASKLPENKVDLRLKGEWQDAMKHRDYDRMLHCLVKLGGKSPTKALAKLKGAGFIVAANTGTIVSGKIMAKDLLAAASIDGVTYMELAVPLSHKQGEK